MREYGQIQVAFWTHPDIQNLTDQGKLLAAYLLTGPHSNGLGCFRCPFGYIAEDLGWDVEKVRTTYNELVAIGFIHADEKTSWVLLPHYLKYNRPQNPSVGSAIAKLARMVPKGATIYPELIHCLRSFGDHLPEAFIHEIHNPPTPCQDGVIDHADTMPTPCQDGVIDHADTMPTPCPHKEPEPEPTLSKDKEGFHPSSPFWSDVMEACKRLNGTRDIFNPYAFVNKIRKDYQAHPQALLAALSGLQRKLSKGSLEGDPWAYAFSIFERENGRLNSSEHLAESKKFQTDVDHFLQTDQGKELLNRFNLARGP